MRMNRSPKTRQTKFARRPAVIDADTARIAVGMNAKHGYALVDVADAWLDRHNWTSDGNGYAVTNIGKRLVQMHELIMGRAEGKIVDHKDRNPLNNRRSNLRFATPAENAMNHGLRSNNRTGYKGVSIDKQTGRFRADIRVNKKTVNLGRYETAEEAARAYDAMAHKHFGDFAVLNITEVICA